MSHLGRSAQPERACDPLTEIELTVLMPCLDEERTLAACVVRARHTLARHGIRGEVLVADNGSRDRSRAIAHAAGARVVAVPVRGYGAAVRAGIAAARGRYVVMGDCDGSYDFGEMPRLVARLRAGRELVLGNRFRGGIRSGAMPPSHRYVGNPGFSALGRVLFGCTSGDVYCGLRGFRRESVLGLGLQSRGMELALEMVVRASQQSLSVAEVPVTLSRDGRDRPPHLRTWRDGWRGLCLLASLSPRRHWLYAMLALTSALCVGSAWLATRDAGANFVSIAYTGTVLALQLLMLALFAAELALRSPTRAARSSSRPSPRP